MQVDKAGLLAILLLIHPLAAPLLLPVLRLLCPALPLLRCCRRLLAVAHLQHRGSPLALQQLRQLSWAEQGAEVWGGHQLHQLHNKGNTRGGRGAEGSSRSAACQVAKGSGYVRQSAQRAGQQREGAHASPTRLRPTAPPAHGRTSSPSAPLCPMNAIASRSAAHLRASRG